LGCDHQACDFYGKQLNNILALASNEPEKFKKMLNLPEGTTEELLTQVKQHFNLELAQIQLMNQHFSLQVFAFIKLNI